MRKRFGTNEMGSSVVLPRSRWRKGVRKRGVCTGRIVLQTGVLEGPNRQEVWATNCERETACEARLLIKYVINACNQSYVC